MQWPLPRTENERGGNLCLGDPGLRNPAAVSDKPDARYIQASSLRTAGLLPRVIRRYAIVKGGSVGRKHDNDLCLGPSELMKSRRCAGASRWATMVAQDEGLRDLAQVLLLNEDERNGI